MSSHNRTSADVEQKVLALLQRGLSGRQVGRELRINESVVRAIKQRAETETVTDFINLANTRHKRIEKGFQSFKPVKPEDFYSEAPPFIPTSDKAIRLLAIGDLHDDPHLNSDRFEWIGKHAVESQPDYLVKIGDVCDLESLSFHSGNDTFNGKFKTLFTTDMDSLDEALERMYTPIRKSRLKLQGDYVTLGNHENRIWRYEDSNPETAGLMQEKFASVMNKYGQKFYKFGQYLKIAGVNFTHAPFSAMGKPIGGMTATQTVARQASGDVVFGHSHKWNAITAPRLGGTEKVTVVDLGCSLPWGYIEPYALHTTTGWHWSVTELTIKDGCIQGINCIPMFELERRYGK